LVSRNLCDFVNYKKVNEQIWEDNVSLKQKLFKIETKSVDDKLKVMNQEMDTYSARIDNFDHLTPNRKQPGVISANIHSPLPVFQEIQKKNEKTWDGNMGLKNKLVIIQMKAAEEKLEAVDEELGEALISGRIKVPEEAKSSPVRKLMREEEERKKVSYKEDCVKGEWQFRHEYRLDLCEAIRKGQINCVGCMTGIGCEWDGPMGELIRAAGQVVKQKKPECTYKQIRFKLYRLYVLKRYAKEINKQKERNEKPERIALPICVEVSIKRFFSDEKSKENYVWFKNNNDEK
jgi:hypothetical protein